MCGQRTVSRNANARGKLSLSAAAEYLKIPLHLLCPRKAKALAFVFRWITMRQPIEGENVVGIFGGFSQWDPRIC